MQAIIEQLKSLSLQKINKGKLPALEKIQSAASDLLDRLHPKANDEDTVTDFESSLEEAESALEELESAIAELDGAEEKDERDDAISMIEDALAQAIAAFNDLTPYAVVGAVRAPKVPKAPEFDIEVATQILAIMKMPKENRQQALESWIQSAGSPDLIEERKRKINEVMSALKNCKTPPEADQPSS